MGVNFLDVGTDDCKMTREPLDEISRFFLLYQETINEIRRLLNMKAEKIFNFLQYIFFNMFELVGNSIVIYMYTKPMLYTKTKLQSVFLLVVFNNNLFNKYNLEASTFGFPKLFYQ